MLQTSVVGVAYGKAKGRFVSLHVGKGIYCRLPWGSVICGALKSETARRCCNVWEEWIPKCEIRSWIDRTRRTCSPVSLRDSDSN
jgi:hypothetical protein